MSTAKGQQLFPTHILHALNALQHLRALLILGDCTDDAIYSTCEDIAREIGAPQDSLWRTLMQLTRAGFLEVKKGSGGGYHIQARTLFTVRVKDILEALGKELPDNGNTRASDRLNNAVADCLDVTLEEFFK